MRFRHDSDEVSCPKAIRTKEWYGDLACMRIAGHAGECIAEVGKAARADGLQHCCRVPLDSTEHRADCFSLLCPKIIAEPGLGQARGLVCTLPRCHEGLCDPGEGPGNT